MAERRARVKEANAAERRDRQVTLTVQEGTEPSAEDKARASAQAFLSKVMGWYRFASDATSEVRRKQKEDLEFRAGDGKQWDTTSRQERALENRPCLEINRIPQFIRQVTNSQRNQNLSIKVSPVDDKADIKVAEVFQGLIRNIEQQSDAQVAYTTAAESQVTIGTGYWRVLTQYVADDSFLQEIRIKRVRNPFTIYFDPATQEADFSDARFCFIVEDVPKDEYRARFGEEAFASLSNMTSIGDQIPDWSPDNAVRIAEVWYVEKTQEELYLIETAGGEQESIFESEWAAVVETAAQKRLNPPRVKAKRRAERRRVYHALISQTGILEGNDEKTAGRLWPGKYIPIVPVLGDEIELDGKVDYRGMVRDAKDPQRLYNYQQSALAETLALAPKTPWVGYLGQFEGLEGKWRLANRKNFAYLEVKPVTANGQIAPLPQRQNIEPPIQAITQAIAQADNDLKATMGLFDPSLGARGPQQSGKAIQALKQQGELANSNFLDNLSRAIRYTGRILIDLIPKIYDAPRVVRIMGLDEQEKAVIIHAGKGDAATKLQTFYKEQGISGVYDLNAGRFDVVVSSGPSVATKRQEAAMALNDLIQAYPMAFPIIGDLLVSNLDWPGAQAAAKRLKKVVPPEARDDDDNAEQPQIPPEAMRLIQEQEQQLQQMGALLQEAQAAAEGKLLDAETKRAQIASNERIAMAKAQLDFLKIGADSKTKITLQQLEAALKLLMQQRDHQHQAATASANAVRDFQEGTLARTHQSTEAAADRAARSARPSNQSSAR